MRIILALIVAAVMLQEPKVSWFDDFLGIRINPTYAVSVAGTGDVKISEGANGILALYATSSAPGTARIRLGEEPGNSTYNALNFSARKNLIYKARVFLNSDKNLQATVGLTGLNDPHNVLALVFNQHDSSGTWDFEVINERDRVVVPTGWIHTPGRYFTVRIEVEWGETPVAKAYIDDELKAVAPGQYIPDGLCAEFQTWNRPLETGGYSQPTLYVDYLSITQDR